MESHRFTVAKQWQVLADRTLTEALQWWVIAGFQIRKELQREALFNFHLIRAGHRVPLVFGCSGSK